MVFAFCFFLVERKLKKIYGSSLKEVHRVKMRQSASIHSTHFKCRNVHCIYMSSNLIIYGLNCTYECRFRFFFFFFVGIEPRKLIVKVSTEVECAAFSYIKFVSFPIQFVHFSLPFRIQCIHKSRNKF